MPSIMGTRGRAWAIAASSLALLAAAPQLASAAGSGSFSPTGAMGEPRVFHAAAPLPDGRVLVAGGSATGAFGPTGGLATTEIYNPATGTFAPAPSMGIVRNGPIAAPLQDGRVLVAGGRGPLSSAQIYNPATNSFSGTGIMQDAREGAAAATLPDGRVLVVGGFDGAFLDTAEIWDPATNLWTPTANSMVEARQYAGAAPLPDGRVLVVGGYGGTLSNNAEIYNPATDSFTGVGSFGPPPGNRGATAASLPDGRVLVAGGNQAGPEYLAFSQAFDPGTGDFSPTGIGPLSTARGFTAGAPLSDGRVLVSGGATAAGITASAEIFAATNTFTYALSGRKLLVTVEAPGKVEIGAAPAGKKAAASKKRKRKALLRPASADGGPGTIELPLLLTKAAKGKLKRSGKVKLPAQISFSPIGGLTGSQTAKLKLKRKRKP
jgi:hypothetical protein